VKVDGTILHGWSSPCASRARSAMWGASYHLTDETSRFILSTGKEFQRITLRLRRAALRLIGLLELSQAYLIGQPDSVKLALRGAFPRQMRRRGRRRKHVGFVDDGRAGIRRDILLVA